MCGICGEIRFDQSVVNETLIESMMAKLERRGPDAAGRFAAGSLGMGHRRLKVIDLSERSNQPMIDEDLGLKMVFNGTIYNYKTLRAELQEMGYHFFSEGDGEAILKAYHCWGEACVERLHGMFAFTIWDETKQQLFVARDRYGIKPLYFSQTENCFRFASNMQALLAGGDIRALTLWPCIIS